MRGWSQLSLRRLRDLDLHWLVALLCNSQLWVSSESLCRLWCNGFVDYCVVVLLIFGEKVLEDVLKLLIL